MSRHPYLQLRGGVYRLRVRVPDELRPLVGKTEITKSLRSSDVKEARERASLERVKLDAEWAGLRRRLSSTRSSTLSEAEIWYLVSRWFVEAERLNANTPVSGDWTRHDAEVELGHVSVWEQAGASIFKEADRLLKEAGIELPPESRSFIQLQKALHKAWIETERRQLNRAFPAAGQHLDPDFAELTKHTIVQPVAKNTVASVMKAVDDDATRPRAQGKSALKRDAHWRVIKEFFGDDTDIVSVTRAEIREFMDLLQRLPSNASKHFPGKTIFEAAELGTARKLPVMSVDTANSYMRQLGSLFRFALNERMIEADPSAGLLFVRPKVKAKDKRLPFEVEDLRAIFAAPLYTGCVDDARGYSTLGTAKPRRGRFWVPLIALYSGIRLNEICQLTLDDIVENDGVDVILIRGDNDGETKRVKTEAGVRFVPIHPELRRIGLIRYVIDRREKDKPTAALFPELPVGTTGYRSDPFSKYFARFLDKVGITHPKKVFHSFRHTYRDALREADISIEAVRALGGWSTGRTEDDYGSGLRASTLAKAIEAISYEGLDLSQLHVAARSRF